MPCGNWELINPELRVKKAGLIRLYQSAKSGDESSANLYSHL